MVVPQYPYLHGHAIGHLSTNVGAWPPKRLRHSLRQAGTELGGIGGVARSGPAVGAKTEADSSGYNGKGTGALSEPVPSATRPPLPAAGKFARWPGDSARLIWAAGESFIELGGSSMGGSG